LRILAIESTAKAASCAVLNGFEVEASSYQNRGLTHSRTLMPMVSDMLKNSGLALSDCELVAVANGPGSFTGVRIGVAAAKGLAFGADLPCIGVSTLEAMGQRLAHTDSVILCAMDARRGEVYNAVFLALGGEIMRLTPDDALPAAEAAALAAEYAKKHEKSVICVGDGAELCYNGYDNICKAFAATLAPPELLRQNAVGVALLAKKLAENGAACDAETLAPVYLRVSQAERERNERLKKEQTLSI